MATYFIQNTNNVEDIEQMNNVINKVNKVNTEATNNIGQLTDLNNKAQELSNNINQALPLNSELVKNTEEAKAANTNLLAVNQEATTKNTELQASLEKTKEFIEGLDGSQNIPQIRMDVTELQNGLKSNQALAYTGSSISAENTLEGRTEGMRISGKTLVNLCKTNNTIKTNSSGDHFLNNELLFNWVENEAYTFIFTIDKPCDAVGISFRSGNNAVIDGTSTNSYKEGTHLVHFIPTKKCTVNPKIVLSLRNVKDVVTVKDFFVIKGTVSEPIKYFEGLKSFGEAEKVEDKYKISILSHGKNLIKPPSKNVVIPLSSNSPKVTITTDGSYILDGSSTIEGGRHSFKGLIPTIMLRKGKKYQLSGIDSNNAILWINKVSDNSILFSNKSDVYTSNEDVEVFFGINYTVTTYDNLLIKPQLEENEVVTQYEPYKENKKDILIKEPLREGDIMYEDNGQVKVYRDAIKYVITGNEDWSQYTDNKNFACMGFFLQLNKDFDAKLGGKFICNNFKGIDTDVFPGNITVDDEIIFVKGRSGEVSPSYIKISILKSKLTTQNVEGFKEWLKANPTEIVYQLATPTTEIVENCVDIDLDTFQDKTYFSIENSLPGTLDFKVPSNIASIVQNTAREVNNIWDVINNLLVPSLIDINKNVAMSTIKNNLK